MKPGGSYRGTGSEGAKVNPLPRYAYNAVTATVHTPYKFRYETGNMGNRDEKLYFPYDMRTVTSSSRA